MSFESVSDHSALESAFGAKTDPCDVALRTLKHADRKIAPSNPAPTSVNGAEHFGELEAGLGGQFLERGRSSGRDELPASLLSTAIQRLSSSSRTHALEETVRPHSLQIRFVAQMLFHRDAIIRSHFSQNQGENA